MSKNACEALLSVRQRRLFLEQFEQDLEFFKLFFLLVRKSQINRHVGVLWARDGPAAEMGFEDMSTAHALRSPCAHQIGCEKEPDPEFCTLINGFGESACECCGASRRDAEKRCRQTGRTQIHTCQAGLVEIAVPVISDGRYIATLLCGRVLRGEPSEEGFAHVRESLPQLAEIDAERLREAYYKVPVAGEEEIRGVVGVMEAFAGHMATAWSRVSRLAGAQHRDNRERALLRDEFAWTVLNDPAADRAELRRMLAQLRFVNPPNRVLLLELGAAGRRPAGPQFDLTVSRALRAVQEVANQVEDCVSAYLRKQGICIFFHEPDGRRSRSIELAQCILNRLEAAGAGAARIGIGGRRQDLRQLAESYDEARTALGRSAASIAVFEAREESAEDLSAASERLSEMVVSRNLLGARQTAAMLPVLAIRRLGAGDVESHRRFFRSALYEVAAAVRRIGVDPQTVRRFLDDAEAAVEASAGVLDVHDAFRGAVSDLLERSRELYAGRARRRVERACRIIDERLGSDGGAARISPADVAERLGISVSHLSRTFRQVTGITFERAVKERRVALARKLLLDPALNVSQVAARCGFSDAAYFARVFRSVVGCTPSEYMREPLACAAPAGDRTGSAGDSGLWGGVSACSVV